MKLMRQFVSASVMAGTLLLPVGSALADTVNVDAAGPGSNQDITINSSASVVETNVNTVVVTIVNSQQSSTGSVEAKENTGVGEVSSGSASNINGTAVQVGINKTESLVGGDIDEDEADESGDGNSSTGGSGGQAAGSVLGSSTAAGGFGGAVATLPAVGATVPVDVSALRAAWQPFAATPQTAAAQTQPRVSSMFMYAVAALLSTLGGIGSLAYVRRKEERN